MQTKLRIPKGGWLKSIMSPHRLVALVIILSCKFALSTCNHGINFPRTIYPAKVNASGQSCSSGAQRDLVLDEVTEDIRNILQRLLDKHCRHVANVCMLDIAICLLNNLIYVVRLRTEALMWPGNEATQ